MERIKDQFLDTVETVVPMRGLSVLEVGSGFGTNSRGLFTRARTFIGIDPDIIRIRCALMLVKGATFLPAKAETLPFANGSFDLAAFTLSLHHIPQHLMSVAIDEAVRVVRPGGFIVFLEPTVTGSYFEAEISFDTCEGDETQEKAEAYRVMTSHPRLLQICELPDETVFRFTSAQDLVVSMRAKTRIDTIEAFLVEHHYVLNAERRINIFCTK